MLRGCQLSRDGVVSQQVSTKLMVGRAKDVSVLCVSDVPRNKNDYDGRAAMSEPRIEFSRFFFVNDLVRGSATQSGAQEASCCRDGELLLSGVS